MARINIEDEFFDDVASVGARMGDIDKAAGQALRLIRYAQTQTKKNQAITYQDYSERFSDALMPEFARRAGDLVEVRGAKTHFAWLEQKREAGAQGGKVSSKRPRNAKGQLTKIQAEPSADQPSSSSSSSSSDSNSTSLSENIRASGEAPPLLSLWNEHRGALPEARSCSSSRLKKVRIRWPEQTPEAWAETIKRMANSSFCCGKGTTGWRADFDFLLKPDTWAKVNEGKYDNGNGSIRTAQTAKYDNLEALERKWREAK